MKNRFGLVLSALRIAAIALLFFPRFASVAAQESQIPAPRSPKLPKITSVEQLLPNARYYVKSQRSSIMTPGLGLKPGEKVMMVTDSTVDPLVNEALATAIREVPGAKLDVIELHGNPEFSDPADVMEEVFMKIWWPDWVFQAAEQGGYQVLIAPANLVDIHMIPADWPRKHGFRYIRMSYVTRDIFASPHVQYPLELIEAIGNKVWQQVRGAREIRVTDPQGTDLTVKLDADYWDTIARVYRGGNLDTPDSDVGHIAVRPSAVKAPNASGVVVASALHTGVIPQIKLTLENGRITSIKGGGKFGERFQQAIEKFKDVPYPGYAGPGVAWLEEISVGTLPVAFRLPNWQELKGSSKWWGYSECRKRSGVIHMAFGAANGGRLGRIVDFSKNWKKRDDLPFNHRDLELYHPTYVADGKVIIENGHLKVLDDPEIRNLAAKYGDPDELLTEIWIPEVGK